MATPLQNSDRIVTLKSSEGAAYTVPLSSPWFTAEKRCRIILVHGYNNSEPEALESYERFRAFCAEYSIYHADRLFYLIWPGDHFENLMQWFDHNTQNAQVSGRNLGSFLEQLISRFQEQDCQFVIIAHSLGCRLTAEMISELHRRNRNLCKQFKLFLMAGAVRSDDIEGGSNFGEAFAATDYIVNLYSPDDHVLHRYFPWGEWGGGRTRREAIGLNGEPREFKSWQRQQMNKFDHGDYWKEKSVVELVLRALGVSMPTALPVNELASYRPPEHFPT
jgi:Alpha/beta hydrolase of unknown function (DUF900)